MLKNIKRINSGMGGDCMLIVGSQRTAVVDTGMAFGGSRLVKLLKQELDFRPLDYVLLSHSHYDHAGGVPYLKMAWPSVNVCGAAHAKAVFERPGALAAIRGLAEFAAKEYMGDAYTPLTYADEALKVDTVLVEGSVISLGDRNVLALETSGHTNCSMSYLVQEEGIMFPCESIGCYTGNRNMVAPILTAFSHTLASIEKCRSYEPKHIFSPHYGEVRGISSSEYFDLAQQEAYAVKDLVLQCHKEGCSQKEILDLFTDRFWRQRPSVRQAQPLPAFTINTKATIQVILNEFGACI